MKYPLAAMAAAALLAACASGTQPPTTQAVAATAPRVAGTTEVLWIGHATVRITTPGGKVLLLDPWLGGNPRAAAAFKTPESLGKVDLVLVTHAHPDHFTDAPAVARMNQAKMVVQSDFGVSIAANNLAPPELVQRLHKGGTLMPFGPGGIKITSVAADHSSLARLRNPSTNRDELFHGGEAVGYVIEMENGFKVWHTGDTALFGDMALIARQHRPDLVMVSMDGTYTMSPRDAAYAMRELVKPKYVMPIHWGTLPDMVGTPAQLAAELGSAPGTPQVTALEPGQKLVF